MERVLGGGLLWGGVGVNEGVGRRALGRGGWGRGGEGVVGKG